MSSNSPSEYVDTREAARIIGLRPSTLETWRVRKSDAIPFIRAGRRVLYAVADLHAFMSANRCNSTSARAA